MTSTITFAGHLIARGRAGGEVQWISRPHEWTGAEVVAVVTRDGEWHAYLIDEVAQDDFREWARGLWVNDEGEFDAKLRFDPVSKWEA